MYNKLNGYWNRNTRGQFEVTPPSFDFTLVTTVASEVFDSPLVVGTSGSIEVDWGDSNIETVTAAGRISHTYTTAGEYTVKVKYLTDSSLNFRSAPSKDSIIRIETQIPEHFTFDSTIDLNSFFTGMDGLVRVCSKIFEKVASNFTISGTSPKKLNMYNMFYSCDALLTVPNDFLYFDMDDLSDTVTEVDAEGIFEGCAQLVNPPRNFLDHIVMATGSELDIDRMFYQCDNLKYAYKVKSDYTGLDVDAQSMYYECTNLETIEDRLFLNCWDVRADRCFFRCDNLKSTGRALFDGYEAQTLGASGEMVISRLFAESTIDSIDPDLFVGMVNATSLLKLKKVVRLFEEVDTPTVPTGLLDPLDGLESIEYMFDEATITSVGSRLCANFTSNIQLIGLFEQCTGLTDLPSDIIDGNDFITSLKDFINGCNGILLYPTGWLDNMSSITDFTRTLQNCSGMTNDADDIWNDYPTATSTNCFTGATNLNNFASIPASWK